MKRFVILACLSLAVACQAEPMIGRISITSPDEVVRLSNLGFSIYQDELPGVLDLIFDEAGYELLKDLGYSPAHLIPLSSITAIELDPEYHTYEELSAELQSLAAQYPDLCRLDSIGCATQFQRIIWSMKLSDNAAQEEDEIALFYYGTHHGNEPLGGETMLYMMNHFLENYGIDPQITGWLDNYEIFFVPLLNPDGYFAVTEGINEFWRKNARDINHNGIYYEFTGGTWWTDDHEGIDLNRNYNWYWTLGGSSDPWAYDYRGSAPFSESELQGIRSLAIEQRFVLGISFHSYGEVVIYPWTFQGQPAPDQAVLNSIAQGLAGRFIRDNGGTYNYYTENGRNGQCRNWSYGFTGALTYCVELNPYPIFLPPGHELEERCQRYSQGAIYLLERLAGPGITGHVTDALTSLPLPARVEIQGTISSQVRSRFAEPQYGRFTRLLNDGTYTVLAGTPGYQTARIENVVVSDTLTLLDIQLSPVVADAGQTLKQEPSRKPTLHAEPMAGNQVNFTLKLQQPSVVTLKIYNLLGREVGTVIGGYRSAGVHEVTFDGSHLASGVYLYRLTTGGTTTPGKLLLVK